MGSRGLQVEIKEEPSPCWLKTSAVLPDTAICPLIWGFPGADEDMRAFTLDFGDF